MSCSTRWTSSPASPPLKCRSRGELYSTETIRQRLNMRDFMDTLRASGIHTGGPPALSKRDRQSFANHLDKMLAKYAKG